MTKLLHLAVNLALPAEATTETFAILARKDGGKTYCGLKLFEEMYAVGAQCVAIDPVGKWWALRLAADGKRPGIDLPIFGGPYADLPLESTAGALIARVIVERGLSAVIDVSLFDDREMKRFVTDFARELYKLKQRDQSVLHLFVEEASTFMPQDKEDGNDPPMLNAFKKLVRKGRNYGIGVTLIDQRAQDVNKKVLNQTSVLIVLGTSGTTDRSAIEKWVRDKHIDASGLDELASLAQGDAFVWLPRAKTFTRIHIGKRWTFDASATPKIGAKRVVRKLTPTDVSALRAAIGESVKRVEAEDPKALQRRVAELENQLRSRGGSTIDESVVLQLTAKLNEERRKKTKIVEKAVLDEKLVARVEKFMARVTEDGNRLIALSNDLLESLRRAQSKTATDVLAASDRTSNEKAPWAGSSRQMRPPRPPREASARLSLFGKAIDMLCVLAQRTRAGKGTSRNQLALFTRLSPRTSTYRTYLSALNSRDYIEKHNGVLYATAVGLAEARDMPMLPTGEQLIDLWCEQLYGKCADMLRALAAAPDGLSRDALAEAVGLSADTSTYRTYLSKLNSCALADKRNGKFYLTDEFKG